MDEKLQKTSAYVWFDAEYTDLDLDRARLLQVAAVVTDSQLNRLLPPDKDLRCFVKLGKNDTVSPWVKENLPDVVKICKSDKAVAVGKLDEMLVEWISLALGAAGDQKNRPVLAGNTIHSDWFLVRKYLPAFTKRLHYRVLDVTTLKLLWQDWCNGERFDKDDAKLIKQYFPGSDRDIEGKPHDAYYDVQASIAELKFYRSRMVRKS
ncbi:MAG: hypothetical protein C0404_08240 [Verrucomicrobia bacterium]|nr:hypothetical protein [Verrucomicrobiota bacterium]